MVSKYTIDFMASLSAYIKQVDKQERKTGRPNPPKARECLYKDDLNKHVGGGRPAVISRKDIIEMATDIKNNLLVNSLNYRFLEHTDSYNNHIHNNVVCQISLDKLLFRLSMSQARNIADHHDIDLPYRIPKNQIASLFGKHHCHKCDLY